MEATFGPTEFLKAIEKDIEQVVESSVQPTTEAGLLPCPWCKNKPYIGEFSNGWYVECTGDRDPDRNYCLVRPDLQSPRHRKEDATADWNNRINDHSVKSAEALRKIISDIREYTSTKVMTIAGTTVISTTTDESK